MSETNEGAVDTPEVIEGEGEAGEAKDQPTVEELQKQVEDQNKTIGSQKRELKKANKTIEDTKNAVDPKETPEKTDKQPDEPDYGQLAYLKGEHVVHPDDQAYVVKEATRLKLPLTDILQMEHVKAKLSTQNDARVAKEGMPDGTGRTSSTTKGSVEYYLDHPDENPEDLELHNKVIDAKMKKIESDGKFSQVPFIG